MAAERLARKFAFRRVSLIRILWWKARGLCLKGQAARRSPGRRLPICLSKRSCLRKKRSRMSFADSGKSALPGRPPAVSKIVSIKKESSSSETAGRLSLRAAMKGRVFNIVASHLTHSLLIWQTGVFYLLGMAAASPSQNQDFFGQADVPA